MKITTTYVPPAGEVPERWDTVVLSEEGDDVITVNLTHATEPALTQIQADCAIFGLNDTR